MDVVQKIKSIYPQLVWLDFSTVIEVRDDSDGKGQYLANWSHPTLSRPTEQQLKNAS